MPFSTLYFFVKVDNFETNGNQVEFIAKPPHFRIDILPCTSGQVQLEDNTCRTCEAGTFVFDVGTECNECPPNLICFGGNQTLVQDGFWREN